MKIERIALDHPLYPAERTLRYEVLRRPLGRAPGSEAHPREALCWHWVARDGARVVGCVLWLPDERRLLQMAVAASHQRQGLGAQLVRALEHDVATGEVHLHARQSALPFYLSLGYAPYGEPFDEVGLVHQRMRKTLPAHE